MLRNLLRRFSDGMRRFMWGRYGVDQLNLFLLIVAVVLCLISFILSRWSAVLKIIGAVINLLAYAVLIWYLFRSLSRNLSARQRENRRFLTLRSRLTDRQSRYYRCPNCGQTVRVPRGHGKICIKCPMCSEKFIRKS